MKAVVHGGLAVLLLALCSAPAVGQESKSAALAKQLVAVLDAQKLTTVAAKYPASPDVFFGALYIPGLQLLSISAQYTAPQLLDERLEKQEYRDVYVDLNAAGTPASKAFIEDLGSNGLMPRPEGDGPADVYEANGRRTAFNRDWRAQQLSEDEYMKIFASADDRYAQMLTALLAQLKKTP